MARAIAQQIDAAYFGNLTTPSPAGLGSLSNSAVTRIVAGVTPTTVDAFAQAISVIQQDGAQCTSFVANPADALTVQTIKTGTGYAMPLLGVDASNGTARQILGVPLLVSAKVPQGVIWGLSAQRNILVMRTGAEVVTDQSVFFTSDRVAAIQAYAPGISGPRLSQP